MFDESKWYPIETAPETGEKVWVHVSSREGLPGFECVCAYHPEAGWCVDEIRNVTHWVPLWKSVQ